MKIRLDFVTNSSSSSFICLAQDVKLQDIIASQCKSPTGGQFVFLGEWLNEGRDHVVLDMPKAELLKELIDTEKVGEYYNFDFLHVIDEGWDDRRIYFNEKSFEKALPGYGQCFVTSCEVDYHGCETVDDIRRQYDKDYND